MKAVARIVQLKSKSWLINWTTGFKCGCFAKGNEQASHHMCIGWSYVYLIWSVTVNHTVCFEYGRFAWSRFKTKPQFGQSVIPNIESFHDQDLDGASTNVVRGIVSTDKRDPYHWVSVLISMDEANQGGNRTLKATIGNVMEASGTVTRCGFAKRVTRRWNLQNYVHHLRLAEWGCRGESAWNVDRLRLVSTTWATSTTLFAYSKFEMPRFSLRFQVSDQKSSFGLGRHISLNLLAMT